MPEGELVDAVDQEPVLDELEPSVKESRIVAVFDRNRLTHDDRTGIDLGHDMVNRNARIRQFEVEGILNRLHPAENGDVKGLPVDGKKGGMDVDDRSEERRVGKECRS